MLTPVGEHELLLFWVSLVLLLGVARGLGALMQRIGQPAVVGELGAGLLLGPTFLGRIAPGVAERIFPGGEVESALILGVAWLGIAFLLAVTGMETDLHLLRRLGHASAAVSIGSLVVPLALGLGLGLVLPEAFVGEAGSRAVFAGFMAVALSISALPVVAKVLGDMRLLRRDFGQITLAAGMVNDLVGWLLLGLLIGVVNTGGLELRPLLIALVGISVFVLVAFSIGQRAVDSALRRARSTSQPIASGLTATVLAMLLAGAITHAIGMEAVIGAFVVGIVFGRSRYLAPDIRHELERISNSVFAPIFFATAGLMVDLGALLEPQNAIAALALLVVAAVAKLAGSYAGGRISGLSRMESVATGIGLNARGAMEIVLASIGLRLGVLNDPSYAAVVLMAMATSMAAPPLLKPVLKRIVATPEEVERLEREELLAGSVLARAERVLLPTRGGANSLLAARAVQLALRPEAEVTVLTVDTGSDGPGRYLDEVVAQLEGRSTERRDEAGPDAAKVILHEARLGYDLKALGLNEEFRGTHELSPFLQAILAETPVPLLLVRRSVEGRPTGPIRRLLVPITGTDIGRAAEEVAYTIGARVDADVDAVHVMRADRTREAPAPVEKQFDRTRALAERFGTVASALLRSAPAPYEELLTVATEREVDLIVIGAQARSHEGRPFLGHGTEVLLERAQQAVLVAVFPQQR